MNNIHALLQRKIQQVEVPKAQQPKALSSPQACAEASQEAENSELRIDTHTQEFLNLVNKSLKEIYTLPDVIDETKVGEAKKEHFLGVYNNPAFLDAFENELPIR